MRSVLYGDTLVEEKFLERIIDQYYNEQQKSKIVWGFVESKKKIDKFVITKQSGDKNNDFWRINGNDIKNIFEHPILRRDESYDFLRDTGVILISEYAWNDILKLIKRIHRPSSIGLFYFANILKQALVFKDIDIEGIKDLDIEIIGIVSAEDPEHPHWNEANYPWEILELNKIKISDAVKDAKWTGEKEESILIREDAEWTKEKEEEIGQKTILVQDNVKFTMSNGARIKGPCILGKNTVNQDFAIQDYAIIEHSYIGDGCKIGNRTSIIDSTLVKDVRVNHDAVIEKSIIMENSVICYHAEVLHSIVGKEVMMGSGVKTPCQRLKNVEGHKT
jgi:NDP-sugar pyrophosphorylase family protein